MEWWRIVSTAKLIYTFPSLLGNLDKDIRQVQLILHESPDFDCFASVYLIQNYILHGQFPRFAKEIAEYAEEIDSGRMKINPHQVLSQYTISLVLNSLGNGNDKVLCRGLELINYTIRRLSELGESERAIDSLVLFEPNHPFQPEEKAIIQDYEKYKQDLETITEKQKVLLSSIDGTKKVVDGLFWKKVPTTMMNRLWARADSNSPSGTGYVFTFVPFKKETIPEKFKNLTSNKDIETTNHVIISVDGNSDVHLFGLGENLEIQERKKEQMIFGKEKSLWRSREERRFPEDWVDNSDPWFDGRNNNYQIVAAPSVGSLLTIEEMKKIVLDYTKPAVKEFYSKIIYPFRFNAKNLKKIIKHFSTSDLFSQKQFQENYQLVHYFQPYIQEYLFNVRGKRNGYSYHFENKDQYSLRLKLGENKITTCNHLPENEAELIDTAEISIGNPSIVLFRYGVGFFIIDVSNTENQKILLHQLLEIHTELCEGKELREKILSKAKKLLHEFFSSNLSAFDNGILYANIVMEDESFLDVAKEEMSYKLTTKTNWDLNFRSSTKELHSMNSKINFEANEHAIMGMSKKGTILFIFEQERNHLSGNQRKKYETLLEQEKEKFKTYIFYIFLLVLHQRYVFLNFSRELSQIGVKNKRNKISFLRENLFDFIIQGWFSQITNDEIGMNYYRKFVNVFETSTLYDEVWGQVSAIAAHQNTKKDMSFSRRFTIVSFFFLIITGITGFFGMNIPFVEERATDEFAIQFSITAFIVVIILWVIISILYWLKNRY